MPNFPIIVSPMAGITNTAFRKILWKFQPDLIISEMVNARALVERNPIAYKLATFDNIEPIRSLQLFGSKPDDFKKAMEIVVKNDMADHIDINFGCPVPKVTRNGAGSATPLKPDLMREIVRTTVDISNSNNKEIPVSIKIRTGLDVNRITMFDAADIAEQENVSFITLHARTTEEFYGGHSDWNKIKELVHYSTLKIYGNGDIWNLDDAQKMIDETSCFGVAVGRGILGKPWMISRDKEVIESYKDFKIVSDLILEHLINSIEFFGNEQKSVRDFRKHLSYYFKEFDIQKDIKNKGSFVNTFKDVESLLTEILGNEPKYKGEQKRGRTKQKGKIHIPHGW